MKSSNLVYSNLITEKLELLSHSLIKKIKNLPGSPYYKKPFTELQETTTMAINAFNQIFGSNDWAAMDRYITYIAQKRYDDGFSCDELLIAFLTIKEVILSFLKKEANENYYLLETEINSIFEVITINLVKKYYFIVENNLLRKVKYLTTLYETSLACASKIKLEDIIEIAYKKLNEHLQMDSFYLALCSEKNQTLNFVSIVDQGKLLPKFTLDLGESDNTITNWVILNKKPLLVKDFTTELLPAGFVEMGEPPDPLSLLTIPIMIQERILGVISLQSFKAHAFNEEDLDLLLAVGSNIALAIENASLYEKTHEASVTDYLTGLKNRLYFTKALEMEVVRANRYHTSFALLFGDIDSFKHFNDYFGYSKGDEILKTTARILSENLRESDTLARFGGDEFIILLPATSKNNAKHLTARFGLELSRNDPPISLSWGVLCYPEDASGIDDLISLADNYLKNTKGRNNLPPFDK